MKRFPSSPLKKKNSPLELSTAFFNSSTVPNKFHIEPPINTLINRRYHLANEIKIVLEIDSNFFNKIYAPF